MNNPTMQLLLGSELDDKSRQREDRQARDVFIDQVFAAARLSLLHISAQLAPYRAVFSPQT